MAILRIGIAIWCFAGFLFQLEMGGMHIARRVHVHLRRGCCVCVSGTGQYFWIPLLLHVCTVVIVYSFRFLYWLTQNPPLCPPLPLPPYFSEPLPVPLVPLLGFLALRLVLCGTRMHARIQVVSNTKLLFTSVLCLPPPLPPGYVWNGGAEWRVEWVLHSVGRPTTFRFCAVLLMVT